MISGGNPVAGSNPSGTGSSINYIGNHAYGYSGVIAVDNVEKSLLQFSTGSLYIVAKVQFNTGGSGNKDFLYKIKVNSEVVQEYIYTGSPADRARADNYIPILLPPNSNVVMSAQNVENTDAVDQIVSIVGRVYI